MSSNDEKSLEERIYGSVRNKTTMSHIFTEVYEVCNKYVDRLVLASCLAVIIVSKLLIVHLVIFMCNSGMVVFVGYVEGVDPVLLALGHQWDSVHFVSIASEWYPAGVNDHILYVFAPLYPVMLALLGRCLGDLYVAGIIISNTFYLMSLIAFYYVARQYMDAISSYISTTLFAVFPTYLVYGTVAYTEPVALFFAISSWYFFHKERHLLASVLMTLAILTRYVFMLLIPIYGLLIIRTAAYGFKRRVEWRLLYLLIPALSIFILFKYFESLTGNFFIIFSSHKFFGDVLQTPIDQFGWFFTGFFTVNNHLNPVQVALERYAFTIPFAVLVLMLFRKDVRLWLYGVAMMWVTMSMVGISGIASPRIMLSSWVAFLSLDGHRQYHLCLTLIPLFLVVGLWVMYRFLTLFFA